jgi:hypothetical protein
MTVQEAGPDGAFRQRVVDAMGTALAELLKRRSDHRGHAPDGELGSAPPWGLELLLALKSSCKSSSTSSRWARSIRQRSAQWRRL